MHMIEIDVPIWWSWSSSNNAQICLENWLIWCNSYNGSMKSTIHSNAKQQLKAWSPSLLTCLNSVIAYICRTFLPQHYNDQGTEKWRRKNCSSDRKMKGGRKNCSGMCQLQQTGLCRPGWNHAKVLAAAQLHQPLSWVCHTVLSTAPGSCAVPDSLPGLVSSSSDLCCDTIMH